MAKSRILSQEQRITGRMPALPGAPHVQPGATSCLPGYVQPGATSCLPGQLQSGIGIERRWDGWQQDVERASLVLARALSPDCSTVAAHDLGTDVQSQAKAREALRRHVAPTREWLEERGARFLAGRKADPLIAYRQMHPPGAQLGRLGARRRVIEWCRLHHKGDRPSARRVLD